MVDGTPPDNEEEERCPHCSSSLRGEPIPDRLKRPQDWLEGGVYTGPHFYSLRLGAEEKGLYDGILYWVCPFCGGTWHRWPEGSRLWQRATRFIHGPTNSEEEQHE